MHNLPSSFVTKEDLGNLFKPAHKTKNDFSKQYQNGKFCGKPWSSQKCRSNDLLLDETAHLHSWQYKPKGEVPIMMEANS